MTHHVVDPTFDGGAIPISATASAAIHAAAIDEDVHTTEGCRATEDVHVLGIVAATVRASRRYPAVEFKALYIAPKVHPPA